MPPPMISPRIVPDMQQLQQQQQQPRSFAQRGRKKVPLGRGFSPMDWARLSRNNDFSTGARGKVRVPMDEVARHRSEDDAWMVIRGKVYNVTPYLRFHPGGIPQLKRAFGTDGTALFDEKHSFVNPDGILGSCCIGYVA
jgi:cytochrome b involved in lipid metabolism